MREVSFRIESWLVISTPEPSAMGQGPKLAGYNQYVRSQSILFLILPSKMLILLTLKTHTNWFSHERYPLPHQKSNNFVLCINKYSYLPFYPHTAVLCSSFRLQIILTTNSFLVASYDGSDSYGNFQLWEERGFLSQPCKYKDGQSTWDKVW